MNPAEIYAHVRRRLITYGWQIGATISDSPYIFQARRDDADAWQYVGVVVREDEGKEIAYQVPDGVDLIADVTLRNGKPLPEVGLTTV